MIHSIQVDLDMWFINLELMLSVKEFGKKMFKYPKISEAEALHTGILIYFADDP